MVGASGPVRGPHPIRASSEQEKEINLCIRKYRAGRWEKKKEAPRCSLLASMQTSDRPASGSKSPTESFSQRIRYVARYAR